MKSTILSPTVRVYLHSFSRRCTKSREIPRKFELRAVQGHQFWCQSKAH